MNRTQICLHCKVEFSIYTEINGKKKRLQNRKFCLSCSPYGAGNNKNLARTSKKCFKCETEKPLEEFRTRKAIPKQYSGNTKYAWCYDCTQQYNKNKRTQNKQACVDYKGGKCQRCGYNKCLAALEFHHRDPEIKERLISANCRLEKMKSELDKCDLLCSNCHKEEHWN
jgi:hypothetical protein